MDIELLSKMVGSLILDNEKVGLPVLGTFVSEFVPASFSDKGYTINPPYKRLVFSPEVVEDDLLVNLYASDNSIEPAQARTILENFLVGVKTVLKERKTVALPGLGRLRATKANAMFFVSDPELQIYPDGFALDAVSLRAHEQTPETFAEEMKDLEYLVNRASEESETTAEPAAEVQAEPAASEPVAEPAASEPDAETEAPAEPEHVANLGPELIAEPEEPKRKMHPFVKFLLWTLLLSALVLVSIAVLGRLAPDFIDRILFTSEELSILNA